MTTLTADKHELRMQTILALVYGQREIRKALKSEKEGYTPHEKNILRRVLQRLRRKHELMLANKGLMSLTLRQVLCSHSVIASLEQRDICTLDDLRCCSRAEIYAIIQKSTLRVTIRSVICLMPKSRRWATSFKEMK